MRSLLPLNYGYRQQEKCGRNPLSFALEKLLRLFSVRNVAFVMFLCIYTLFVLLLRGGFPLDDFPFRSQKSKVLIRDIHDDYDVGCNGYSMDFRIAEQQRILRSVRSELIDSSAKLQEVNIVYEDLTKKIPEKQLELTAVLDEIESARRTLKELQDRKNVRIFLPHKPIQDELPRASVKHSHLLQLSWETAVDLSRCSIATFMPLYITNHTQLTRPMSGFMKELSSQGIIVKDLEDACLSFVIIDSPLNSSSMLPDSGRNTVIVNFGEPFRIVDSFAIMVQQSDRHLANPIDFNVFLDVPEYNPSTWKILPNLLPYSREFLLFVFVASDAEEIAPYSLSDLSRLNTSAMLSGDNIEMLNCSSSVGSSYCGGEGEIERRMRNSTFCLFFCRKNYTRFFWLSLRAGCIPVVPSVDTPLPFQDHIDWRLASIRFHPARFPELHFIIRSLEMAEVLELRRMGRFFFERYLGDNRAVVRALLASLREKLEIPSPPEALAKAVPLFNNSFTAPILTPINVPPLDDEYLGPLEGAVDSASYLHNFSSLSMYSYHSWNVIGQPGISFEFLAQSVDPPTESEFYPDSNIGFRPIEPGSGVEFSKALGGNRAREQFTGTRGLYP
ncbi:hypothetical protein Y032_0135g1903 [Ancylostoma ceylanicum]|nr:hypothetical protein Y032_0135g1903 [Ancylostoma ceylanicum]